MPKMKHIRKFNEEFYPPITSHPNNIGNENVTRCVAKISHLKVILDDFSSFLENVPDDFYVRGVGEINREISKLEEFIKLSKSTSFKKSK